jgi:hypothetical protein
MSIEQELITILNQIAPTIEKALLAYVEKHGTHSQKTHGRRHGAEQGNPQDDVNVAVNGSVSEIKKRLEDNLGWTSRQLNGLNERQLRMALSKRMPNDVREWLKDQGDTVALLHGTTKEQLDTVLSQGLKAQASTFAGAGQAAGVFLVPVHQKRWAEYWGNRATKEGETPIIIEVTVPKKALTQDIANPKTFLISTENISPESIKSVTHLSKSNPESFSFSEKVIHPLDGGEASVQVNDIYSGTVNDR